MADHPARPPTPQALVHRLPDKPDLDPSPSTKPSKFIILIAASTAVAGKVQVAQAVSSALGCPLYQGDSLHETAAKAASVGTTKRPGGTTDDVDTPTSGPNEARYQRMWLSKMTRTGLLFPEESRAAGAGFSGFGGRASPASSRRGSVSSDASDWSEHGGDSGSVSSVASNVAAYESEMQKPGYVNRPPRLARAGGSEGEESALLALTHPLLQGWHRECIRKAVGEYGIGVIFVPLDEGEGPVLKVLDPRSMTGFGGFGGAWAARDWSQEILLGVDADAKVEELAEEIIDEVKDVMRS